MKPAAEKFQSVLNEITIQDTNIPVIANVTADVITSGAHIQEKLIEQLYSPVLWYPSIEYMVNQGVDTFIEIGPGKVLAGLMKSIDSSVKAYAIYDEETLKDTISNLRGKLMLKGKVALVTGASRGIGRAIAIDLAKQGANVVVNYAGNEQKANEVVDEIKKLGSDAIAVRADVANAEDVTNMVKQTVDVFGQVDILVNNAGVTKDNLLMRMKEEEWDTVINTNLKGVFLCTKAVSRFMMRQRHGRIVNIASVVGVTGNQDKQTMLLLKQV